MKTSEKLEWAQKMRLEGNKLYNEGDYREALDVYLTCLVAKCDDPSFTPLVFLPVMLNIAQCSLQMGMMRKAIEFCNMALDEVDNNDDKEQPPSLVAKLYFRRGRAQRLSAEYNEATSDLQTALRLLENDKSSPEYKSVEKEIQLVQRAETEERVNEKRQQRAMQQLLGGGASSTTAVSATSSDSTTRLDVGTMHEMSSLYENNNGGNKRAFSTVRAAPQDDDDDDEYQKLNCWQWYLSVVGQVAVKLLILMGDEEYVDRRDGSMTRNNERKRD